MLFFLIPLLVLVAATGAGIASDIAAGSSAPAASATAAPSAKPPSR